MLISEVALLTFDESFRNDGLATLIEAASAGFLLIHIVLTLDILVMSLLFRLEFPLIEPFLGLSPGLLIEVIDPDQQRLGLYFDGVLLGLFHEGCQIFFHLKNCNAKIATLMIDVQGVLNTFAPLCMYANAYLFGPLFGRRRINFGGLIGLPLVVIVLIEGLFFSLTVFGLVADQTFDAQVLGSLEEPLQLGSDHVDLAAIDEVHDGPQVLGTDSTQKQQRLAVAVLRISSCGLQQFPQHGARGGQNNPKSNKSTGCHS